MKRLLLIHDLCSVGKAAMMNMIPVLEIMGIEVCPLPTVLLSTHTGGFGKPEILNIPGSYLKNSLLHLQREKIHFDCIFVGYLGNKKMVETVLELLEIEPDPMIILDPIMGDHGKYYSNFDENYKNALIPLIKKADLLLPNLTEASFLTGIPYEECQTSEGLQRVITKLKMMGMKDGVITGTKVNKNEIGMAISKGNRLEICIEQEVPYRSHGTGDLFDAVVTGGVLRNLSLREAAIKAHSFVAGCLKEKVKENREEREGLPFEYLLGKLV